MLHNPKIVGQNSTGLKIQHYLKHPPPCTVFAPKFNGSKNQHSQKLNWFKIQHGRKVNSSKNSTWPIIQKV